MFGRTEESHQNQVLLKSTAGIVIAIIAPRKVADFLSFFQY
jgi:hypothetical protein